MKIIRGLYHQSVLQRNHQDLSVTNIKGYSKTQDKVHVKVSSACQKEVQTVSIINQSFIPSEDGYLFTGKLIGIPVGGPYTVEIIQDTKLLFKDIFVGDLYVLAGQSNMEGVGKLEDKDSPSPLVKAFYMDEHWDLAEDPLHDLSKAVDPVHTYINGGPFESGPKITGTGPGVTFAKHMQEISNVPVAVIPCAHGGTSMDQWSPNYKENNHHGLYHMMMDRIEKAGDYIKGMFWYQGCNDANHELHGAYSHKMIDFVQHFRKDLNDEITIVMVQISRCCSHDINPLPWNSIQEQQINLVNNLEKIITVSAIDLEMDDFIHISGRAHKTLGYRAAHAMAHLLKLPSHGPTPILKKVNLVRDDNSWNGNIVLTYDHISSHLTSQGLPTGFTIHDNNIIKPYIYQIQLNHNQVILKTTESILDLSNCKLSYGHGYMPYCNITDQGRALTAFHMLPLGNYKKLSTPATVAWITNKKNEVEKRDFYYYFLNAQNILDEKQMVTYHLPFRSDSGDYDFLTGASGHLEIILDGKIVEAVSLEEPIAPDQHALPLHLEAGNHLLTIRYTHSNGPKGIFARFSGQNTIEWLDHLIS